jgi:hypothetical protein
VVLYHHDPYLLKARNRNLYQLCAMVSLAANIASHFKVVKADDPIVSLWKGPEMQDFRVDNRLLVDAVARVNS